MDDTQRQRVTYGPLIDRGFELARSETATVEEAQTWLRRAGVARAVMGAEAFDALVKDREAVSVSQGQCPYAPVTPPCAPGCRCLPGGRHEP